MKYYKFNVGVRVKTIDGHPYLVDEKTGRGILLTEENKAIIYQLMDSDNLQEIAVNLNAEGYECDAEAVEGLIEFLLEKEYLLHLEIPALRKLTIYLTNQCNLSCGYCMFASGSPMPDELTTEEILDLVKQGVDLGIQEVVLTGGEPLEREDLDQIITYIKANALKLTIDTNGITLTEERIIKWVNLGVNELELNLDSFDRETNDTLRGEGTYDQTMRVIEWCKKHKLTFTIASVICKPNFSQHKRLGEYILSLGAERYSGSEIRMLGRALETKEMFELTREENIEVILYTDLWKQLNCPHRQSKPATDVNPMSGEAFDCNIGMAALVISPTGNMIPCGTFPMDQPLCGNIRTKRLQDIWFHDPFLRKIRKLSPQWIEECDSCVLKYICGGGCRALSLKEFGSVDARPDAESCGLKKGIFARIGEFYTQYGPNFAQWFECLQDHREV